MVAKVHDGAADSGDEFGVIDDEELLQAESDVTYPRLDMKRASPYTSTDAPITKRVKSINEADCISLGKRVLREIWGFPDFRLKQEAVIARLISGGSAVVIFPTGGGKSLVYQIPGLAFDMYDKKCGRQPGGGVTLVVSPLIALMKVRSHTRKSKHMCLSKTFTHFLTLNRIKSMP